MTLPDLFVGVDPAAQAFIRRYCGWHIAPNVTEQVTLKAAGGSLVMLPTLHLTGVAEVTSGGAPVTVSGDDWWVWGELRLAGRWVRRGTRVSASITHGYDECPADVQQVAQRVAQSATVPVGASAQSAGPYTIKYGQILDGLDDYSHAVLDHYRILVAP